MAPEIGIVVPTIGERPQYLPLALQSIRMAGSAYVILVGRPGVEWRSLMEQGLIDQYIDEIDPKLPAKINLGFRSLPSEVKFLNWLGDDDLLTAGALDVAWSRITAADSPVLVFGGCEYIGPSGETIFTNKSGSWAPRLMRFGPQLIPQPGALYRRDALEKVGYLEEGLGWAFDFELFLSLSKIGRASYIPVVLAKFRWHPGSLSVSRRLDSVREASAVRVSHLPEAVRPVSALWEYPVRAATYLAGKRVSRSLPGAPSGPQR